MDITVLELRAVTDAFSGKRCGAWIDLSGSAAAAPRTATLLVDGSRLDPPVVASAGHFQ